MTSLAKRAAENALRIRVSAILSQSMRVLNDRPRSLVCARSVCNSCRISGRTGMFEQSGRTPSHRTTFDCSVPHAASTVQKRRAQRMYALGQAA
ncbi:hypothetical protein KC353_g8 [Hortaea werneckii]|nr:hypothetical protein KC353_g8 [Hortaea werneckii]